jgi:hypothetical protein
MGDRALLGQRPVAGFLVTGFFLPAKMGHSEARLRDVRAKKNACTAILSVQPE